MVCQSERAVKVGRFPSIVADDIGLKRHSVIYICCHGYMSDAFK